MGLERVYILSSSTVFYFNSHGLFLGKVPDLEKIHSNYSRERKKTNKQKIHECGWKKSKNVVLVGENTEVLCKTHPSAFDV